MSEAEGEWADLLHESALEAVTAQASAKPASVPKPAVTSPQRTRYATSPQKGSNDDQEGEEDPTHAFDDDSEDDTSDSQQVLSYVGAAQAPSGYKILKSCPSLETEKNIRSSLVRRSCMPGTTRTGRDDSREGYMTATSTREMSSVLSQPIFLCDTDSR
jgi:hypothetical protein